ncbi:hypothetical protein [Nostoc sp. PCC 7107]|uniref:hypothetical protein n=1 Tax=Nostoc sp. PCC 7107 TaxID=317936 RepID=UPI00029EDCDD|nr:hypothetical protein [Nostoc sp. PCC 7107]AFY41550.1 hypothetical protein Nos7107_0888 [Nostoc sp. PCC 7107]
MSIPKKGTRKILVDGETFIWLIRRQATNCQSDYPDGHIHVAVEHAYESGSVLVVITDKLHSQGFILTPIQTVKPKDVAELIKQATQLGWLPKKSGRTFKVCVISNSMMKACGAD